MEDSVELDTKKNGNSRTTDDLLAKVEVGRPRNLKQIATNPNALIRNSSHV